MKQLKASYIAAVNRHDSLAAVSEALDTLEKNGIGNRLWPASDAKPQVAFAVAHHSDCIFLKYYVRETSLRAVCLKPNEPVYQDSCVEFFIAFGGDENYYNLEFNCLGTCLLGYGAGRNNRQLLPEKTITQIKHLAVMQSTRQTPEEVSYSWQLTLLLPVEIFCEHRLPSLQGVNGRANFFKCGGDLPEPHFLAWSGIDAPEPNFHLPEFFGRLSFE